MNKNKSRNGETNQSKKKLSRPVSHDGHSATKRRNKHSGINYDVNISSSGTNLHKKIQDEMMKLENVEKKIRNHKTKVKAICSSRVPNEKATDHKLKHMLEEMLDTIDSVKKVPKKRDQKLREVQTTSKTKRREKTKTTEQSKKCVKNEIKMESLTVLRDEQINKNNIDMMRISTPPKRSALKKPKSAPSSKERDFLVKDLRFAESLNFRKDDFQISISDINQNVVSPRTKNRKKRTDLFNFVVEKASSNDFTCVYDSTPSNNECSEINPNSHATKDDAAMLQERNFSFQKEIDEDFNLPKNQQHNKPERKRFYSFLKRGNFTISQHTDDKIIEEKNSSEDSQISESVEVSKTKILENSTVSNISDEKEDEVLNDDIPNVISGFPSNLIERSILAVENVLRTIKSITKDYPSRENIEDEICENPEDRTEIDKSALHFKCLCSQKKSYINDFNAFSKMNSVGEKITMRQEQQNEIVMLKSPVTSFLVSEEIIKSRKRSQHVREKADFQCNYNENLEPINRALNSLRNSSIKREGTMFFTPEHSIETSCSFSSSCSCGEVSQRLHNNSNVFIEQFSSKTSYLRVPTNNFLQSPKNGNEEEDNSYFQGPVSQYTQNSDMGCSNIFPEYNYQKCLALLRKKFRDFERMRYKNLDDKNAVKRLIQEEQIFNTNCDPAVKNVDATEKRYERCVKNSDECYEVCFKNENFKDQSEISIECWNRTDVKNAFKSSEPTECKAKSSPEI